VATEKKQGGTSRPSSNAGWASEMEAALHLRFEGTEGPAITELGSALQAALISAWRCFRPGGDGSFSHVTSNTGVDAGEE